MLSVTEEQWVALGDSLVSSETVAQASYQTRLVDLNVKQEGQIRVDGQGEIQASADLVVFGMGDSLVPKARDAFLAPYGQEITLSRIVRFHSDTLTIPLGVYRIVKHDTGRETRRGSVVLDWEVGVSIADRFRALQRGKLIDPKSPPVGATLWSEARRLALSPVQVNPGLPDATLPASMVYDTRLSGVHDIGTAAGAKPRFTRQGALTYKPADRWLTETTPEFDIQGTIGWDETQSDDFYNVVWAHSQNGDFSAFAQLSDDSDPRSMTRAGPSTYEHSSPLYTSQSEAQAGAETILDRLLNRRSRHVTVEVGAQGLLLELSDFGWVRDPAQKRAVLGEVSGMSIPLDPTQPITLELIVAETE